MKLLYSIFKNGTCAEITLYYLRPLSKLFKSLDVHFKNAEIYSLSLSLLMVLFIVSRSQMYHLVSNLQIARLLFYFIMMTLWCSDIMITSFWNDYHTASKSCKSMEYWLSSFKEVKRSQNVLSALVKILLAAWGRLAIVTTSDNGPAWK